nr:hypothetical protein [Candidatus Sigynarchaeota archaeon]
MERLYDPAVFAVHNPACKQCGSDLEFHLFENFEKTGMDWIQWYCARGCGYHITAEIT